MSQETRIFKAAAAAALSVAAVLTLASPASAERAIGEDGWAHRSPQTTAPDGWSVRTQPVPVVDGWAARSLDASRSAVIRDGFEVSLVELPQTEAIRDGWEVASVELPRPATVAEAAPAPSRPSSTTGDLVGMALASASAAVLLTGMAITFHRRRQHAI